MINTPATPDPADDPLAAERLATLLNQAYETTSSEPSLDHLRQQWGRVCRESRRRILFNRSLLVAAASIAAMVMYGLSQRGGPPQAEAPVREPAAAPKIAESTPPLPRPREDSSYAPLPAAGLPPTTFQRALFAARSRSDRPQPGQLAELLTELVDESPSIAQSRILSETNWTAQHLKTRLERELFGLPRGLQPMAIALLGQVGGKDSIPALQRLGKQPHTREPAARALLRITEYADMPALLKCAPAEAAASLLLTDPQFSSDPRPLHAYLSLVYQPSTRAAALASLASVHEPPIDRLMSLLDAEEKPARVAAALALGKLGGPEVTERLIRLVTSDHRRHAEAWLAVVQCRGPLADQFLSLAARDPLLLGHYYAALIRQQQVMP
jgi:hypothetical protein